MPRGDGTGPMGAGSMTGRGAGYCAGYGAPGYANSGPWYGYGRGFGRGRGRGFGGGGWGWRHMYYATGQPGWMRSSGYPAPYVKPDPEAEKGFLKDQADALQQELDSIKKRLSELEGGAE
ncbi:MAG: DUF5320 domain-containing protein [Proteobacteria bacterium]|nr:DUF5320 domain-containing protein [Pseudomonadota bacterium]